MIEMEKPNIECTELSADGKYGKFVVGPLERGYGTTIGNSLRRILLSSLPGAACTSIKIEGIQHEFSTVPGVLEDVTEIILNLKKMAIKLHSDEVKTVYIDAKGAQEITAGDIKCDSDVEIFNPELHIATLNSDAKLNAEITISKGRGYVSAERNKAELQPIIGVIPMDSIYTPVTKVNYTVENVRVGQYTDREELAVEVWTNGTVKPDDAVSLAAKIMNELHTTPYSEIAGFKVVGLLDYLTHEDKDYATGNVNVLDLPKSDVITFKLENGATVVIRPSGTEPKIKAYYTTIASTREEAVELGATIAADFNSKLGF